MRTNHLSIRFDLDIFEDEDGSAEENESDADEDQDETMSNESDSECQPVQNQPKKHDCGALKSLLEQRDCVSVKRLLIGASKDNLVSSFNVLLEHIDALFRSSITTVRLFSHCDYKMQKTRA